MRVHADTFLSDLYDKTTETRVAENALYTIIRITHSYISASAKRS